MRAVAEISSGEDIELASRFSKRNWLSHWDPSSVVTILRAWLIKSKIRNSLAINSVPLGFDLGSKVP